LVVESRLPSEGARAFGVQNARAEGDVTGRIMGAAMNSRHPLQGKEKHLGS